MKHSINQKKKGNRNELECAKLFNKRFGAGFARVPSSGAWSGGLNRMHRSDMSMEQKLTLVSDIMTPPDFRFTIEHKAYKSIKFWDLFSQKSYLNAWVDQVTSDADFVNRLPMIIMKFNNKPRIAMVNIEPENWGFCWKDVHGVKWYCHWLSEFFTFDDNWWYEVKDSDA